MRLDSLIRLIESADFMAFRELAMTCLSIKGYQDVTLTDGWSDGGTDVRVFQLPPNPTKMGFQITVDRDWKGKLKEDAHKVMRKLKLAHMTLVTSRRVPEAEFQIESELIWRNIGVRVTKMDSQSIASTFFMEGKTTTVLSILGIDVPQACPIPDHQSARADAAYSFVFFGKDTNVFRDAAIESAIISLGASHQEPIERKKFEQEVRELLQISDANGTRVTSAFDRLIQSGDLAGPDPTISLSHKLADATRAMCALRDSEWDALRDKIEKHIQKQLPRKRLPNEAIDAILSDLGALLLDSAQNTYASLEDPNSHSVMNEQIRQRLRHLHATFDTLGFDVGDERDRFLEELAEIASNSPIGKNILSGELFISLCSKKMPQLIRALGARSDVQVLLDSSVAIPMLCALLYKPVNNRFSTASYHAFNQLQGHGLNMILPIDYLEESATHLLLAYKDYEFIIDVDPDLTASDNAFVSYYVSLKKEENAPPFLDYLNSFGLDNSLRKADFYIARDNLRDRLSRLFDRYSINAKGLDRPSKHSQRKAEEGIAYAINDLNISRPDVLIQHDARTIAYLHDCNRRADIAHVLCTWDGVHFHVRNHEKTDWQALNPAALGDILSLASPSEDLQRGIATPKVIALSISEETAKKGAAVWDHIVRIERGKMHDAELLRQAQEFKEQYISSLQKGKGARNVVKAWTDWKAKHNVSG